MNHYSIDQWPVVLVTGGARRIGAEICKLLHANNFRVIVHYNRSEEDAKKLADDLNQKQPAVALLKADLNRFDSYQELIQQAQKIWNRLDVLVNNASSFFSTLVGQTNEEQWQDLFNTNLKSAFFLSQAAAPFLKENNGCIINIADIHGFHPLKNYSVYSIAKAGLIMATRSLARELAPHIRVNAVAPGKTELPDSDSSAQLIKELRERTLLKRFPYPDEIAQAVLFFIQQSAITGQILNVDCGRNF